MTYENIEKAVRAAARLTVYWRKRQIAVIGGAILLIARQTGAAPMAVLHNVMEWLDDWLEENGKGGDKR